MRFLLAPSAALMLLLAVPRIQAVEPPTVDYQRDIQPILARNCYGCHSEVKVRGGLRVDSLPAILKGGINGPAVVFGKSSASLLAKKSDENDPTPHKGTV